MRWLTHFGRIGLLATLAATAMIAGAQAQTFSNTSGAPLNETVASCAATPLLRTFSVAAAGAVADVNLSALITHTYRGDLELVLQSPAGTRVQLTTRNGSAGGDNLNVTFDDGAGVAFSAASISANHAGSAPPYAFTYRPDSLLSAFNGQSMAGNWRLEMCDAYNADQGNFVRADLTLTAAAPNADLSLALAASVSNPATGTNTELTLTVTNAGSDSASAIEVTAPLPTGLTYVSDTGGGAYDALTGIWTVPGTLGIGASTSLQVTAAANASGSGAILAEIISSSLPDLDSTPNNRNTDPGEDDTASLTLLINGPPPGTPPTLNCPVARTVFDWDANAWPAGSVTQTYAAGVGVGFTFAGDTGTFVTNAAFGGQTPITFNALTGGLSPAQNSLLFVNNFTASSQRVELTVDIGIPGEGVENLQFSIFDVDVNPNTANDQNFIDRIRVFGFLSGVATSVILTPGATSTASGSTATGTAAAASASADGTVVVSFDTPVDQLVVYYDNDPAVASNPGQQGIAVHDLTYCTRGRDHSDAPATYGAPAHLISPGFRLGSIDPDRDTGALPGASALGDDGDAVDDEDALSLPPLTQGQSAALTIPVAGAGGYLRAWIDWNGNAAFDAGELVADDLQTGTGSVSVPLNVPVSAATGQTYARLRWSGQTGLGPDGDALTGEVEDHVVTIEAGSGPSGSCPAGFTLAALPGTASSVVVAASNSANALGTPETPGTAASNANSAKLDNANQTLVLDLQDLVAGGAAIALTIARDNNSGNFDIDVSPDNATWTTALTFSAGPNDVLGVQTVTAPSGGARYVRFARNGGNLWVGGVAYDEVCAPAVGGLLGTKSMALYDPLAAGLFAIPGNDVIYTITVANGGAAATDVDTISLIDAMPANVEFYFGATPEFGNAVVGWSETGTGLTFDPISDVAFSKSATAPPDFAGCTDTPVAGYDPGVTYICFNPKGVMAAGQPDPEFSISFRARIR